VGARRAIPVLLLVTSLSACGAHSKAADRQQWTTYKDAAHAFTVSYPSAWHRATRSLTPHLTDPHEILTLATYDLRRSRHPRCAHVPEQAVKDLGDADVLITVQERRGPSGFPPRRKPTDLGAAAPVEASECAGRSGQIEEHWLTFRDRGRGFHVYVAFGRHAPTTLRDEARRVLDSLAFEAPVRRRGVRLLVPFGWHLNAGPLTSVQGEALAVASYPIPDRPPDRNCTPKAAIDALPHDGALLYLFEYFSPNATQLRRFPVTRPYLRLSRRATRPYECLGTSELVRWRERGRAFQAHLYLGRDATAQRRRELRAVFDSLLAGRE
jgi:hypothetical protein